MTTPDTQRPTLNPEARDDRFLRAISQVLRRYELTCQGTQDGQVVFAVGGGHMEYEVQIPATGPGTPTCSCPDARNHAGRVAGGYCKHIIGCLMRTGDSEVPEDDLTFHLLDVLL